VTIREGVRAMLALRHAEAEAHARRREQQGWTAHQLSDDMVLDGLGAHSDQWTEYKDPQRRDAMLARFHAYAYQWY
jgi:hypothetical protein